MCGIAGVVSSRFISYEFTKGLRVLRNLTHRGPDDQGIAVLDQEGIKVSRNVPKFSDNTQAALFHRRLSILDLSELGRQPMSDPSGRYAIVFNGEIYNYVELRRELEHLGWRFRSQSDTEVLLAGFVHWGKAILPRLIGMFAFAILDSAGRKLFLCRDFFGIKPLYYCSQPEGFFFASEIGPLLELSGAPRVAHPERLLQYLRWSHTDYGHDTLLKDIHQLPAAHWVEIDLNKPNTIEPTPYWQVRTGHIDISFQEAALKLRELFLESIQLHLRSDVPVGAALSGGIDSSSIVCAMRHAGGRKVELHAISYIADDPALSEEAWIDQAAAAAGARVHKIHPTATELEKNLPALIRAQGEPFGSTSIFAQYEVFKRAHETGLKVMLDGQGADELLGGYRGYLAAHMATLLKQGRWLEAGRLNFSAVRLPGVNRRTLWAQTVDRILPRALRSMARRAVGKNLFPAWLDRRWFHDRGVRLQSSKSGRGSLRDELMESFVETSLPHLLRYEDRNSMAFSVESRVPFLTPQIADFVFSLPEEYIVGPDGTSKAVFRAAMRGIVPDSILDRKDKIGFATPEKNWLQNQAWVDKTIQSINSRDWPMFSTAELRRHWTQACQGKRPFDFTPWRWINFIEWAKMFDVRFQ
jgi:asparagine synthase (glutamine-hydrolysing)